VVTVPYAVGVCGFGRCGSTMTMRMLDAGGLPPVAGSSSRSYELHGGVQRAWHTQLVGGAVKLLDSVLYFGVPPARAWRFVWLDRDPVQQATSQIKLIGAADPGAQFADDAVERLAQSYEADRPRALGELRRHGEVLVMQYERVLANPRKAAKQLRQAFPNLHLEEAAAAVHQRDGACRPDMSFELGRTE
jgi:hypothetical protein